MPDFNRTEASAAPASIAINAVLEAGARVFGETTRNYLGAVRGRTPMLAQGAIRLAVRSSTFVADTRHLRARSFL